MLGLVAMSIVDEYIVFLMQFYIKWELLPSGMKNIIYKTTRVAFQQT